VSSLSEVRALAAIERERCDEVIEGPLALGEQLDPGPRLSTEPTPDRLCLGIVADPLGVATVVVEAHAVMLPDDSDTCYVLSHSNFTAFQSM